MSRFWSNNVELLEKREVEAAVQWASGGIAETNDEVEVDDEGTLTALMDMLQGEHPGVFRAIMDAGADRLVDFTPSY